jgi:3-isopropylmalate/(R)-2-methylmalate dehydratase small subunit
LEKKMSSEIKTITGKAIVIRGNDIDTDRIIPARYLKSVTFDGLGEAVFADDRQQLNGKHPFDLPQHQGAKILVVNRNFGCGSSREHAPQAIAKWGIGAIVAESFAEIFLGNCTAIGIPCTTADSETIAKLQSTIVADPDREFTLDLVNSQVTGKDTSFPITTIEGIRNAFITGAWDACGQLVANTTAIQEVASRLPYLQWT